MLPAALTVTLQMTSSPLLKNELLYQFAFVRRIHSEWRLWEWATSLNYFETYGRGASRLPRPLSCPSRNPPFSFSLFEYDLRHTEANKDTRGTHKQSSAMQGRATRCKARQSEAKQSKAEQSNAMQSKAKRSKARQGEAKQASNVK